MNQPYQADHTDRADSADITVRMLFRVMAVLVMFMTGGMSFAARAADIVHGKALIESRNCASCHGANLNRPISPEYPKLAGQHPDYVYWALRQYQMGADNPDFGRNNPVMHTQVQNLSSRDMQDIAAYIGSLKGDLVQKK